MISVVIPLYNKEKAIIGTLNSVLAQTYTDYEVVVVNDGSTDHSQQVVEEWLNSSIATQVAHHSINSSFRLIHQPNSGVSSARNRGIQEAKGEYIAFLDGDDLWAPTYLEELAKLITDYPKAGIYGIGCCHIGGNDLPIDMPSKFSFRGILTDWFARGGAFTGSSTTIRKDVFDVVGMFDSRMTHGEDLDMWWRVLLQYDGAFCDKPLAYYRQDSENRAMHRVMPLEKHVPFYMDKFADARAADAEFRKFFDTQMVYRLYPYLFEKKYRKQAKRLAKQLDYSQLKWSMHFRMICPKLYNFLK